MDELNDSSEKLQELFEKPDLGKETPTQLAIENTQSQTAGFVKVIDSLVKIFINMNDSKNFFKIERNAEAIFT